MADLSAVLRKTIDGMPGATPQLRARVYDKARAAIERQLDSADPPLPEAVIEARRAALEDAIERTEGHYLARDAEDEMDEGVGAAVPEPAPAMRREQMPAAAQRASVPPHQPPQRRPAPPAVDAEPVFRAERSAPAGAGHSAEPIGRRPPNQPHTVEARRPAESTHGMPAYEGRFPDAADTEDADGVETAAYASDEIPPPDLEAPRYVPPRKPGRSKRPLLAAAAVLLLLGGAGAAAWSYRDQIEALLVEPAGAPAGTLAGSRPPGMLEPEQPAQAPAVAEPAGPTEVAALPGPAAAPAQPEPAAPATAAPEQPGAAPERPGRRFTQRLLPDGTEVDEGPGAGNSNAFEEGTNIAAASPAAPEAGPLTPGLIPAPEAGAETALVPPGGEPAATPPGEAAAPAAGEQVAALPPTAPGDAIAVAQKAVFYEERSAEEPGTQQGGNVRWSVVNEPPAEGQPPEPAIRAVADVPEEGISLTMTIRRNADETLPASHVIELLFDVPPNFAGGQIANVQRLALKPTEQARGEPLIGVAGKISDGFFIIALNNLDQAIESNIELLNREQWIDIPLAYSTGRRALMSIEKGIPGDRAFKEAMDAWAAKT